MSPTLQVIVTCVRKSISPSSPAYFLYLGETVPVPIAYAVRGVELLRPAPQKKKDKYGLSFRRPEWIPGPIVCHFAPAPRCLSLGAMNLPPSIFKLERIAAHLIQNDRLSFSVHPSSHQLLSTRLHIHLCAPPTAARCSDKARQPFDTMRDHLSRVPRACNPQPVEGVGHVDSLVAAVGSARRRMCEVQCR